MISAAQSRAARALLDWSQDELAINAQVARPTIADFERNVRTPMRNNLVSIVSAFEAAGVAFISDNGEGAGVRFKKVELEYNRSVRDRDGDIAITVRYRGKRITVVAPRDVIDDMDRANYRSPEERAAAVTKHFPKYLVAAEKLISSSDLDQTDLVILRHDNFPAGTF